MRRLEKATVLDRAGPGRAVQRAVNSYADLVRAAPIGVMPSIPASAIGDLEEAVRLVSAIAPRATRYVWESSVVDEFLARLELRLPSDDDCVGAILRRAQEQLHARFPPMN